MTPVTEKNLPISGRRSTIFRSSFEVVVSEWPTERLSEELMNYIKLEVSRSTGADTSPKYFMNMSRDVWMKVDA